MNKTILSLIATLSFCGVACSQVENSVIRTLDTNNKSTIVNKKFEHMLIVRFSDASIHENMVMTPETRNVELSDTEKKELNIPSDKTIETMELAAKDILNQNNIFQYEVSSWSKNNKVSKHNMNYWLYGDYLGIGPGAHSKITAENSITRMIKLKKVESYINNPSKITKVKVDDSSYDLDLAMNLLRIKNGTSFEDLEKRGIYISDTFKEKLCLGYKKGLIEKNVIKATNQGYKFLNDTVNTFN